MEALFQHGKHTISRVRGLRYSPLEYGEGYIFSTGVAFGQLNQVLDLAAKKPRKAERLVPVAKQWIKIIEILEQEQSHQPPNTGPIGFMVPAKGQEGEGEEDDSDTSQE